MKLSRRQFLGASTAFAVPFIFSGCAGGVRTFAANEKVNIGVIGIGALLSVLALTQGLGMGLLVVTVLYAFLTIQVDGSSILDFLRRAACFLFLRQQYYEWRQDL